jgi:hypothetical protein
MFMHGPLDLRSLAAVMDDLNIFTEQRVESGLVWSGHFSTQHNSEGVIM